MKRILMLVFVLLMTVSAAAEDFSALMPGAAVEQLEQRTYRLTVEQTGEVLLLTVDDEGMPLRLETVEPAAAPASGEQPLDAAELAAVSEYPSARVLASELLEDGSRVLLVLADDLCGALTVRSDAVADRALDFGEYASDGRLTEDGARAALALLRPGLVISEIEPDEDDGMLLYEGEAILGGSEYEFELSASTGRLLEWERD